MADVRPLLVTGGNGFIGRALTARLARDSRPVIALTRGPAALAPGVEIRPTKTLSEASDWPGLLAGAGTIIHLASRAHLPLAESERSIAEEAATAAALARAAANAGVERLVLMSSIKVLGEGGEGPPYRAGDQPAPADSYGRMKLAIEQAITIAAPRLPLVILRPPLVYGAEVKANLRALIRLVDHGLPLPLASIENSRSLIYRDNLVDLLLLALAHPAAPGRVFLCRDADVSTPALVREIARALGRPSRLFPFPPALLRGAARLAGRAAAAERLIGSLRLDDAETRQMLGWRPRIDFSAGIAATCRWYRDSFG